MALTEKQQEKVQVCENNRMRGIVGVTREYKRRRDELRVEVGGKESFMKKLRSGLWKEWETTNWQRDRVPRKMRGKGGEEDRECDGRTGLRGIWKEWVENGEQQQKIEGTRDW